MRPTNIVPVDETLLFNLAAGLVAATATLTSDNTQVTEGTEVVVGAITYVFKATALTAAVAASATLTSDETQPDENDTVTVGSITYTFKDTGEEGEGFTPSVAGDPRTYTGYEVALGEDADETLQNLVDAINCAPNDTGLGTKFSYGTKPNPDATAADVDTHATVVTAKVAGTDGNAIAKAEDSDHLDWDGSGAVFTGGVDTIPNEVLIGADADGSLQNLVDAINGTDDGETTGPGITYGLGTTANPDVSAADVSSHASIMTARVGGVAGNSIAKSEDDSHLDWDGTGETFSGGGGTKAKHVFTEGGFAHRFLVKTAQMTGTPTVAVALYNENDVLIKTLAATAAENALTDTAYEVEIAKGDYILLTASATVSDAAAEAAILMVR